MKRLQILFWLGIFVGLAFQPLQAAQTSQGEKPADPQNAQRHFSETRPTTEETQKTQISEDSGTAAEFGKESVDFTWLFLKTLFAMLVVIALAVIALRFFLPRLTLTRQIKGKTDFRIVDRLPIDTKRALYVIEIEGRRLLLAASEQHVGLVTELKGHEGETSR